MPECQKFAGTEMNRHSGETLATQCVPAQNPSPIPNPLNLLPYSGTQQATILQSCSQHTQAQTWKPTMDQFV